MTGAAAGIPGNQTVCFMIRAGYLETIIGISIKMVVADHAVGAVVMGVAARGGARSGLEMVGAGMTDLADTGA